MASKQSTKVEDVIEATEVTMVAPVAVKRCGCGCLAPVNPKSTYLPGHDARFKGSLLRKFDEGDEAAGAILVDKGWKSEAELEARRTKAEEKATRAAEKKAEAVVKAAGQTESA
jgi:peptide subunit release factor 1 (eRF1)